MTARPRVLLVDDDDEFASDFAVLSRAEFEVIRAADYDSAQRMLEQETVQAVFLDIDLGGGKSGIDLLRILRDHDPDLPVVMISGDDRRETAVQCLGLGAIEFVSKRPRLRELRTKIDRWWSDARWRQHAREIQASDDPIVGSSAAVVRLREELERVAKLGIRVLIHGETGTGKELVADTLHRLSNRRDERFVKTSAANDPDELFEDRLFGHQRGAFTGAAGRRAGLLEMATGGTLFLDEVGKLSLARQAKLLRVVETGTYDPLGATAPQRTDFRLLTASNEDLRAKVSDGTFAGDFYYRIAEYVLPVPPLRERREDIPAIAAELIRRLGRRGFDEVTLAADACDPMLAYDWPGNVRELNSVLVRAAVDTRRGEISSDRIAQALAHWTRTALEDRPRTLKETLEAVERATIQSALLRCGRADDAADELGVSRSSLYRRIAELGISLP